MSEPMIDVVAVSKFYERGKVAALRDADLRVEAGEIVALVGPSGCGKSTLLHLLAALERPSSGTIRVDGVDLATRHDRNRYRRLEVGLVFQLHNLIPRLTACENVEMAMFGTRRTRRERRAGAEELLGSLGLAALVDRVPPRLSGGERQRVAIARAIANRPRLLLADEPTGSLDAASVGVALDVLAQQRRDHDTTIVIVTHDPAVAAWADRIVELRAGQTSG
jgi:ABC-type lipoprotein export system ATPase subunit